MTDKQRQNELRHKLDNFGDPRRTRSWEDDKPNYIQEFSLTEQDIPQLLAVTREWIDRTEWPEDQDDMTVYAPVHAWRSLGQLKAIIALPLLLEMNAYMAEENDDWNLSEFPHIFCLLGPCIIPQLAEFLNDSCQDEFARICCAHGLTKIAQRHTETRLQVIKLITDQLNQYNLDLPSFNGLLVGYLLDLKAVESAEIIERAFAAKCVDLMTCGDWFDVRMELGVEGIGLVTEKTPLPKTWGLFNPKPEIPINVIPSSNAKKNTRKKRKAQRRNKKRSKR